MCVYLCELFLFCFTFTMLVTKCNENVPVFLCLLQYIMLARVVFVEVRFADLIHFVILFLLLKLIKSLFVCCICIS